ncbi:hypothetical protein VN24_21205 [Paenibacillus beijingensis]|uniref:Uncharacterized protein n=1 Tax=Paenibacillus beijingensis TaxID=1126833 RepID=A0A0D5NNB5_9BACL|nr:hypothetical protein VN24_21205 [Paenibacillus beijingensis]
MSVNDVLSAVFGGSPLSRLMTKTYTRTTISSRKDHISTEKPSLPNRSEVRDVSARRGTRIVPVSITRSGAAPGSSLL